ncbi:MAG TPA: hypothetical protein DET40_14760 [Lentisphaeria bacterium]|nr:MAG: hypothetical protein A2X45_05930 [Lentisphaerae bacterium GWF2_50_93]HCE44799.1 hypothetical protein [Lentisphaeria bacterium]
MKKLLLLIAFTALSVSLYAQTEELMGYVPGNVDGFACLDIKELGTHPKVKEMIDTNPDPQLAKFKDNLKQNGIDIYNAFSTGVIFFNGTSKKGGAVFKTGIDEATFSKLIDNRDTQDSQTQVKRSALDGKTIYIFEKGKQKTSVAYLKPNVIAISDLPEEVLKLASISAKENVTSNTRLMNLSSKADKKSPLWAVFVANTKSDDGKKKNPDPMQQMLPIDNIQGGLLNMKFTGDAKDTVNMDIRLNCKEKSKAQMLTVQFQAMVMMYIPALSQGNQQLSEQLMKSIKFTNEENDIVISAVMDPALQEELKKITESSAANMMNGQLPGQGMKKKKSTAKVVSPDEPALPQAPKAE